MKVALICVCFLPQTRETWNCHNLLVMSKVQQRSVHICKEKNIFLRCILSYDPGLFLHGVAGFGEFLDL